MCAAQVEGQGVEPLCRVMLNFRTHGSAGSDQVALCWNEGADAATNVLWRRYSHLVALHSLQEMVSYLIDDLSKHCRRTCISACIQIHSNFPGPCSSDHDGETVHSLQDSLFKRT